MPIGLFTLDLQGRFLSANPALAASCVKDLGTGAAVIQRPSVDQRLLSSVPPRAAPAAPGGTGCDPCSA